MNADIRAKLKALAKNAVLGKRAPSPALPGETADCQDAGAPAGGGNTTISTGP